MDKEKQIEEMAEDILKIQHGSKPCFIVAETLVNAGYGNVKQAVKEFAERLKKEQVTAACLFGAEAGGEVQVVVVNDIDDTFKELYGED